MLDMSKTGASHRARKAKDNPRQYLEELMESHPDAGKEWLRAKYVKYAMANDDRVKWLAEACFANDFNSCERFRRNGQNGGRGPKGPTPKTEEQKKAEAHADQKIKDAIKFIVLMDLEMPNGKRLRYCKRSELVPTHKWIGALIKMGKPDDIMGQAHSEAELLKVYRTYD